MSGSTLPPPPPPSGMTPPPGYVAYQGPEFRGGGLSRVRSLAVAAAILAAVAAIGQIITIASNSAARDAARDYFRDRDTDAFNERLLTTGLGSLIVGGVTLGLAIVSVIWLHRVVSNHRNLGRNVTWSPGWAIGGWFLPPCLFVIPFLILRESFKAADPTSPLGTETWRNRGEHPLPWIWLLTYGILPLVLGLIGSFQFLSGLGGDAEDIAENILDTETWNTVAQGVVGIVAAGVWALLVWTLTQRHMQLTGEANAR